MSDAPTQSADISALAAALCKVQAALTPAAKTAANPFFKSNYCDLPGVWENARAALAANGLSVAQMCVDAPAGHVAVRTLLMHSSGQWLAGVLTVKPAKDDPQGMGSAITYARRYALAAMVGATAADEDDDGNAASAPQRPAPAASRAAPPAPRQPQATPPAGAVSGATHKPTMTELWAAKGITAARLYLYLGLPETGGTVTQAMLVDLRAALAKADAGVDAADALEEMHRAKYAAEVKP